jgi:molybdenum cofactor cytidylyltransferase
MEGQGRIPYDCILLAAGESRRMGTSKQFLDFDGRLMVEVTLINALKACRRVVLVQGAVDLAFLEEEFPSLKVVTNPDFRKGQLTSLQRGLQAAETDRAFIMLADLPLVSPSVYHRVAEAIGEAEAAYPTFGDCRGHPVLVGPRAMELLLAASPGNKAMRVIADLHPVQVALGDPSVCRDADTPEDFKRLKEEGK